jgi:MFS transporter, CP family, cyanate transporter
MEDDPRVISAAVQTAPDAGARRGRLLIGVAIVLTGLNLRTAVTSVGPVLEEIESGLGISSGLAGLVTTMPVLCFAAIGFAGPPLSARFRDSHVLGGALLAMAAGLVLRSVAGGFALFLAGTVVAMVGGALGNVLLPGLVKRYFPGRTGLLIGAYSTALGLGGAAAAVGAQPIADAAGAAG